MNQTTVQKSNKNQKNRKNRFKSKKSDLNQKKSIFLIFIKKIAIFINPATEPPSHVLQAAQSKKVERKSK